MEVEKQGPRMPKRPPGRPPKTETPVTRAANARENALQADLEHYKAELEEVRRNAAAESGGVDDLVAALTAAHDMLLYLRDFGGLGFTANVKIDLYLAETGHLIGRGTTR